MCVCERRLIGHSPDQVPRFYRAIGLMSRVFANGPGDRGSIPG